jgi:hypothetical protein
MKKVKALKEFFSGDKTLAKGDLIETTNERAADLVKQSMAEYVGDRPPLDPMLVAHLEPEPEPPPPELADPADAEKAAAETIERADRAEREAKRAKESIEQAKATIEQAKAKDKDKGKPAEAKPEPHVKAHH